MRVGVFKHNYLSISYFPVTNRSRFRRKADTYFVQWATVCLVGAGIALFFYLRQGFIGCTVKFEFEDIDVVGCFHDAIHPSFALLLFGVDGVAAYHAHQQVECVCSFI